VIPYFVFNPNLSKAQVDALLAEREAMQRKTVDKVLAGADTIMEQITAGKLPASAMQDYIHSIGSVLAAIF
jgi:hypothetical protein